MDPPTSSNAGTQLSSQELARLLQLVFSRGNTATEVNTLRGLPAGLESATVEPAATSEINGAAEEEAWSSRSTYGTTPSSSPTVSSQAHSATPPRGRRAAARQGSITQWRSWSNHGAEDGQYAIDESRMQGLPGLHVYTIPEDGHRVPCLGYYLSCCGRDPCEFSHKLKLTSGQVHALRVRALELPCNDTKEECTKVGCYRGHACPKGRRCAGPRKGCRFTGPGQHPLDHKNALKYIDLREADLKKLQIHPDL